MKATRPSDGDVERRHGPSWLCTLLFAALLAHGCADPIVGARCVAGFRQVDRQCVLLPDAGVDGGGVDASLDAGGPFDAGPADAGGRDGSMPPRDGAPTDGSPADAGAPVCDLGELLCGGLCVRPGRDPMNCGACGVACAMGEVCAGGSCVPTCDPPLRVCRGLCLDLSAGTDPDNCGACRRSCPSGICVSGRCVDATAGHVVAVGHDYRLSRPGMRRVAGNAVFLAPGSPVRVLALEGSATRQSMRGVDRAIDQVAAARGRAWTRMVGFEDKVLFDLAGADVFVIYPQVGTSDATLRALGAAWSRGLATFLRRGGIIVMFDAPGMNLGTWQVLDSAGLLSATGIVAVTGDTLSLVAAGDAVALGVPLSYRAEASTVRFATTDPIVVVSHPDGPVVVHRVVRP